MSNPYALIHLGTTIAASFLIFSFIGYWLDQRFGWGYIGTVSGAILALIYIFYIVWKLLSDNGLKK